MAIKKNSLEKVYEIKSILGGFSSEQYDGSESNTYYNSVGIDPDFAISNSTKTSGAIVPISYQKFSGANVTGSPMWLMTNPNDTNLYAYHSDGKLISYNSSLASETVIGTPTSGAGNGAAYYNNYLYLATPTNIARYGPLNGSPSLTNTYWTGLGLTALTNTTYPSIGSVPMPNHVMHVHGDNFLYISDFVNGQGYIHRLRTKKVTVEGDTNDNSAYGAFILPFGYMPTAIESFDTDLIVSAIQTTSSSINQGRAAIFLINPVQTTFYKGPIYLTDPLATAILSNNGSTHVFSGNGVIGGGMRVTRYAGGLLFAQEVYQEEGYPPLAGAVSSLGNRICWGSSTVNPQVSASVFAFGYKKQSSPSALHNIINTTSAGASPQVTALLNAQQSSNNTNRFIVGWKDASAQGIDKLSETVFAYNGYLTSDFFEVGQPFFIKEIRIPLAATIAAGMACTPYILLDDASTSVALTAINSTNYTGRKVLYKQPELVNCKGTNNFQIALNWAGGTVQLPVIFPIRITIELYQDENN